MDITQLGFDVGIGSVLGIITGYAAKKAIKLFAVLVGLQLGLLAVLENNSIIRLRWSQMSQLAMGTEEISQRGTRYFIDVINYVPSGGGFVVGATIGFKRG